MTDIQPIETVYRGYRFRSRLEARWAVFLDVAEIPWQYETQGFDLNGVRYLPDFWLPRENHFLEIKPDRSSWPDAKLQLVLSTLANISGKNVFLLSGYPSPFDTENEDVGEAVQH